MDRFADFIENPVLFHERLWFYPGPLFLRVGIYDQNCQKIRHTRNSRHHSEEVTRAPPVAAIKPASPD